MELLNFSIFFRAVAFGIMIVSAMICVVHYIYNRTAKATPLYTLLFMLGAVKIMMPVIREMLDEPDYIKNILSISDSLLSAAMLILLQFILRLEPGKTCRVEIYGFLIKHHAFLIDIIFAISLIVLPPELAFISVIIYASCCLMRGICTVYMRYNPENKNRIASIGTVITMLGVSADMLLTAISVPAIISNSIFIISLIVLAVIRCCNQAKKYGMAQQHETMLNERVQVAETAFMNAQMKPHFIYNALNTIADRCTTEPEEAERLILSLSKYMRQTLSYDSLSGITPLKKELELVKAYTDIECKRFDNIDVYYILPDELPDLSLPPLSIQPLVENAIKHGLRKKHGGGWVAISLHKKKEDLYMISVEDNGVGINDEAKLAMLNLPSGCDSIGLYNINQRLLSLYGSGLSIENPEDGGTRVCFEVPLVNDR